MADLAAQARPAVDRLLTSTEEQLYVELGARLEAVRNGPEAAGSFDPPILEALGPVDDLRAYGQRFFARVNADVCKLVCGAEAEDVAERQKLLAAFGIGREAVAATLAALLIAHLGLAPAVAPVVAALVVRLFFQNAYGAMCDVWQTKLGQPTG